MLIAVLQSHWCSLNSKIGRYFTDSTCISNSDICVGSVDTSLDALQLNELHAHLFGKSVDGTYPAEILLLIEPTESKKYKCIGAWYKGETNLHISDSVYDAINCCYDQLQAQRNQSKVYDWFGIGQTVLRKITAAVEQYIKRATTKENTL